MERERVLRYTIAASEHSGGDLVLWLRYLGKWVDQSGHIFTKRDLIRIMKEKRIEPIHRVMLSEAIIHNTPTNRYVIRLNEKVDYSDVIERIRSDGDTA